MYYIQTHILYGLELIEGLDIEDSAAVSGDVGELLDVHLPDADAVESDVEVAEILLHFVEVVLSRDAVGQQESQAQHGWRLTSATTGSRWNGRFFKMRLQLNPAIPDPRVTEIRQ